MTDAGSFFDDASPELPRLTTGSAQLDAILGGGLPASSINIIMGEPGSGKTILAEQLLFANAESGGRPSLYFTTLSEPLGKVVRYLQQFEFFDEALLADGAVSYQSIGAELERDGIAALVPVIADAIKTLSPKIIVIDSFKAIHDLAPAMPEMRRMLYALSGLLSAYDVTTLLVGEYREEMISTLPEFAVADAMIELARRNESTRDERYLRVLKLRGSGYQEGLHSFRIGPAGLAVFPRLSSPTVPVEYDESLARVPSGVRGLDELLDGGLWEGSQTLVQGPTGSGKTTLGLQFMLAGLARGEPGIYLNFQENPTRLARTISGFGLSLEDAKAKGLHLIYASPVELQMDSILVELFEIFSSRGVKRVAIDAVGDLLTGASDVQRVLGYLYALGQHFQVRRASGIMTLETATNGGSALIGQLSAMSDNIFTLGIERVDDTARRTIQITKSRGTAHEIGVKPLRITQNGVEVG
jgi:circadian clock protein KaiC